MGEKQYGSAIRIVANVVMLRALFETGQEWNPQPDFMAYWQLQYRSYRYHGHDFSHWSLKLGAGIPWPW